MRRTEGASAMTVAMTTWAAAVGDQRSHAQTNKRVASLYTTGAGAEAAGGADEKFWAGMHGICRRVGARWPGVGYFPREVAARWAGLLGR